MSTQYNNSTKQWKRRIVSFHPIFKDKTGSTNAAILLQQIAFWSGTKDDGWFYKTQKEWGQEISFSLSEIKIARKALLDLDLIEYETRGSNNRGHYRLNNNMFEYVFGLTDEKQPNLKKEKKKEKKYKNDYNDITDVIDAFVWKERPVNGEGGVPGVNPMCNRYYNRHPQKQAADDLITNVGKEKIIHLIKNTLPITNAKQFYPTITTPYQLAEKISQLASAMNKQKRVML